MMKLAFLGVYPLVEVQEQCNNPFLLDVHI